MAQFNFLLDENSQFQFGLIKKEEHNDYSPIMKIQNQSKQLQLSPSLVKGFYCPVRNMFLIPCETQQEVALDLVQSPQSDQALQDMFSDLIFSGLQEPDFHIQMKDIF